MFEREVSLLFNCLLSYMKRSSVEYKTKPKGNKKSLLGPHKNTTKFKAIVNRPK